MIRKYKIAITGGDGLVGSRIIDLLKDDFEFIVLSHQIMDITNKKEVYQVIKDLNFDFFIHLAAYTNVSQAEVDREICYRINVEGTKNVFEAVLSKRKKFIYFSTDFVFDGKNPPYYEDSFPNPLGFYGKTKYEGEKTVKDKGMIIRISYPYRACFEKKKDFLRNFLMYLIERKPLKLITDSLMTPTLIDDIAFGLRYLIKNHSPEIFHLVGSKSYSPYKVVQLIADKFHLNRAFIGKISYFEYVKIRAGIPQYSDIRSRKNDFWKMSDLESGLEKIKDELMKGLVLR